MVIEALTALQDWAPVEFLRNARWTYAAVNAAHIAGFALLVGAIVPLDLRLMGWRRSVPLRVMARVLLPVAIGGLVLAIVAGLALFSVRAVEYAGTTLFQFKMTLVVCGIGNALLLHRAAQWEAEQGTVGALPPARLRVAGALSILIWLAVLTCGRLLAFID
jgi:hypothetical protein